MTTAMATRGAALLLAATLVATGCSTRRPSADKAGGRRAEHVVLTLATTSYSIADAPPVQDFVDTVARLSHGSVQIMILSQWGNLDPHGETKLIKEVARGQADLGFVGSRAFDLIGVDAFDALTAPMLVTSYPLEKAVLASSLPAQMLPSLRPLGITGIGVFGDALRLPVAVRGPLTGPVAWHGVAFGTYPSLVADAAIRALGARTLYAYGALREHELNVGRLGGFEYDVDRYAWYSLPSLARYVTANVVLWPQVDVVFGNPRRLASLSAQQRAWLSAAARVASGRAVSRFARRTPTDVRTACSLGAQFVRASARDLAELKVAVRPAYTRLERDPRTVRYIAAITKLKEQSARQPSALSRQLRCPP